MSELIMTNVSPAPQESGTLGSPARVWVVDDDALLCRALRRLLNEFGFDVETFLTGGEVLAAEPAQWPDCLVVDIRLGVIGGFDLHRQLRDAGLRSPIIFITADTDDTLGPRARGVGAAAFLRKPINDDDLVAAIENALARPRYPRP
jgi:FixJ family two-component response regulator